MLDVAWGAHEERVRTRSRCQLGKRGEATGLVVDCDIDCVWVRDDGKKGETRRIFLKLEGITGGILIRGGKGTRNNRRGFGD